MSDVFLCGLFDEFTKDDESNKNIELFGSDKNTAQIRCYCNQDFFSDDLIKCKTCNHYLHKRCLPMNELIKDNEYTCYFCKLKQSKGDIYADFQVYIDDINRILVNYNKIFESVEKLYSKLNERYNEYIVINSGKDEPDQILDGSFGEFDGLMKSMSEIDKLKYINYIGK